MKTFFSIIGVMILLSLGVMTCNMWGDGTKTIEEQYKPSAMLKKYEYFKDLSGAIDKKDADIQMYQTEIAETTVQDKESRFYLEQRKVELMEVISSTTYVP